jgi:hypothetical protein
MTPHKHAEAIRAWADGAIIEVNCGAKDIWSIVDHPSWTLENNYRVMPEPKADFVKFGNVINPEMYRSQEFIDDNLRLTFDGQTGKLKSAEVI